MQLQLTKRLSSGFTGQTSWTWSRGIGEGSDDGGQTYLNPRNRSLNKTLLDFHRTHGIISNGTYELPFGPGRPFLGGAPGFVTRLVEQWQLGGIFNWSSGAPINIYGDHVFVYPSHGEYPRHRRQLPQERRQSHTGL